MAQFCKQLKLLFLLLLLSEALIAQARPSRTASQSDLIAGNEFLKLFLEHGDDQREFEERNSGGGGGGGGGGAAARGPSARSLDYKGRNSNDNLSEDSDDGKQQVLKLVTSGTKIVFLEEYDDDDAVVDAVARDIDLQKERVPLKSEQQSQQSKRKAWPSDEIKVVAVSVSSSSSKRAPAAPPAVQPSAAVAANSRQQERDRTATTTARPTRAAAVVTSTLPASSATATVTADFINRSHKSEFSIEEAEPLTMSQSQHKVRANVVDSVNSASTNVQNILAAPAASASSKLAGTADSASAMTTFYVGKNTSQSQALQATQDGGGDSDDSSAARTAGVEDKLLPFQTVIYHDTKEGHGPQSRSISYSSISQNVEDLHDWQHSRSILAEAQRNVSESLIPMPRPAAAQQPHTSEPAKFYSVPAKMYGVPSKFYSEPAKVYSEPAKVYGQPEKFYSEPAKVYGQPSKFYSEPAKVYSQPAKVYGEPAKSYWPQPPTTTVATTTSSTAAPTTSTTRRPALTTAVPLLPSYASSRRPAIVSRIAFGEAQSSTPPPNNFAQGLTAATSDTRYHHDRHQHQHQIQHNHNQQQQQQAQPHAGGSAFHSPNAPPPRRILFNLDKLPYDLLNAPEPDKRPPAATTFATDRSRQRPCFEAAATSPLQQQHQYQLRRQHSSLPDQHSNQNAKGLPNGDLVKCVSNYAVAHAAHAPAASSAVSQAHFTTERSHSEDLYTPTPEQNYEIEESVSVMTNGRAHGVQGGGGTTTTSAPPIATRKPTRSRIHFGVGVSGGSSGSGGGGGAGGLRPATAYNTNANANEDDGGIVAVGFGSNSNHNNNNNNNNNPNGYNYEDEYEVDAAVGGGGGIGGGGIQQHHHHTGAAAVHNNNNNSNGNDGEAGSNDDGNDDDDDSKVAYVVEGRNYRKYRVEEKTDDGFIVGEYGVVDHNDGNLRGVRYTADSTINRSLIQKALLTFLKLK